MVGIAFLYLPIGYSHSGWAFGVVAFIICAIFSSEGFNRLVHSHEAVKTTYAGLAERAGGQTFRIILEIFLVMSQVLCFVIIDNLRNWIYSFYNHKPP